MIVHPTAKAPSHYEQQATVPPGMAMTIGVANALKPAIKSFPVKPQPIIGHPHVFVGGKFVLSSGSITIEIKPPSDWAIGPHHLDHGVGEIPLFPKTGGVGCKYTTKAFKTEDEAKNALLEKKGTYPHSIDKEHGFVVKAPSYRYACKRFDTVLLEITYSVPGNRLTEAHERSWDDLYEALTIKKSSPSSPSPFRTVIKSPDGSRGYTFNKFGSSTVKEKGFSYDIDTKEPFDRTFVYIAWDQDTSSKEAYQQLANKIKAEFRSVPAKHFTFPRIHIGYQDNRAPRFAPEPKIHLENKFATLESDTYIIMLWAHKNDIFGFVVNTRKNSMELNEVLRNLRIRSL